MPSRLRRIDEPGHVHFLTISCYHRLTFFYHDAMKIIVIDALHRLRDHHDICLISYVIMPDHIHLIIYPHKRRNDEPIPISIIIKTLKQYVGYYGKNKLREMQARHGTLWSPAINEWMAHQRGQSVWMKRAYDFNITRHKALLEKIDYCHKNPVTADLVTTAEDWPWSSFRFYEYDDRSIIQMDWSGHWPIEW